MGKKIIVKESVHIFKAKEELPAGVRILDIVPRSLRELLIVRNPELKSAQRNIVEKKLISFMKQQKEMKTVFIYYPWSNIAIHIPEEKIYTELRTARNRNLITKDEQEQYRNATVGITGLSIGLNIVSVLVLTGGPKQLKLADPDVIEVTNLNRMRAPISAIGLNKAEFAAQHIWELDPFAQVEIWNEGVTKETLQKFILEAPRLDVYIDEMDSLDLKFLARILCKKHRIPVVMATDNGDNVILDIERFDEEPEREIFHGLVKEIQIEEIANLPYSEWVKVATKIVGPDNLTLRMRESLREIGKTIAAVPQLGTTATIGGTGTAYAIRKIVTGQSMPSGRYFINMDEIIS